MIRLALIILAAGASTRFGANDKLTANLGGQPLLEVTLKKYMTDSFSDKMAVVAQGNTVVKTLANRNHYQIVENYDANNGVGSSIAAGVKAITNKSFDGVMIALGDMPFVSMKTIQALVDAFSLAPQDSIITPLLGERRGHPVIFASQYFHALSELSGDTGARTVIERHIDQLTTVLVKDDGVIRDIDRPNDLD